MKVKGTHLLYTHRHTDTVTQYVIIIIYVKTRLNKFSRLKFMFDVEKKKKEEKKVKIYKSQISMSKEMSVL